MITLSSKVEEKTRDFILDIHIENVLVCPFNLKLNFPYMCIRYKLVSTLESGRHAR